MATCFVLESCKGMCGRVFYCCIPLWYPGIESGSVDLTLVDTGVGTISEYFPCWEDMAAMDMVATIAAGVAVLLLVTGDTAINPLRAPKNSPNTIFKNVFL